MLTRKASKWRPITPWRAYPDAKSWAVKEVGPRYRGQLCASAIPADHPLLRVGMTCSRAGTGRSTDLDRMGQADPLQTFGPAYEIETPTTPGPPSTTLWQCGERSRFYRK